MAVSFRVAFDVSVRIHANTQTFGRARPITAPTILPKLLQSQNSPTTCGAKLSFTSALPASGGPDPATTLYGGSTAGSSKLRQATQTLAGAVKTAQPNWRRNSSALGGKLPKIWPLTNASIVCCRAIRQSRAAVCIVACWGWLAWRS